MNDIRMAFVDPSQARPNFSHYKKRQLDFGQQAAPQIWQYPGSVTQSLISARIKIGKAADHYIISAFRVRVTVMMRAQHLDSQPFLCQ